MRWASRRVCACVVLCEDQFLPSHYRHACKVNFQGSLDERGSNMGVARVE